MCPPLPALATTTTRWCPTPEQLMILEEMYKCGVRTPKATQIQRITAHLSLYGKIEGKNVFYWFQNHKARDRQKLRRRLITKHQQQQQQHHHHHHHHQNDDQMIVMNVQQQHFHGHHHPPYKYFFNHVDVLHPPPVPRYNCSYPEAVTNTSISTSPPSSGSHHHVSDCNSSCSFLSQVLQGGGGDNGRTSEIGDEKEQAMNPVSRSYDNDWVMIGQVGPESSFSNGTRRPQKTLELFPIPATSCCKSRINK